MTVHLPDELRERLAAEAARQGKSVDALVAEMVAAQLPAETSEDALDAFIGCGSSDARGREGTEDSSRARLSFIGIGASGGQERVAERHREIIREHFAHKTASDV